MVQWKRLSSEKVMHSVYWRLQHCVWGSICTLHLTTAISLRKKASHIFFLHFLRCSLSIKNIRVLFRSYRKIVFLNIYLRNNQADVRLRVIYIAPVQGVPVTHNCKAWVKQEKVWSQTSCLYPESLLLESSRHLFSMASFGQVSG